MTSVKKQTATLNQDGPLSIPTGIREAAHLKEGDTVLVEAANGDGPDRQSTPGQPLRALPPARPPRQHPAHR